MFIRRFLLGGGAAVFCVMALDFGAYAVEYVRSGPGDSSELSLDTFDGVDLYTIFAVGGLAALVTRNFDR